MPNLDAVPEPSMAPDAADVIAFRRSLRASRARRTATATRRRRRLVGRRGVALALSGLAVASGAAFADGVSGAGGASAPQPATATKPGAITPTDIGAVQRALHVPADGVAGRATRRAVRRFQRAHGLVADGVIGSATLAALGITPSSSAPATTTTTTPVQAPTATLAAIARCESGGNPGAVSRGGRYRGKYQFSRATWRLLGGTGDPAKAPEALQDQMAAKLMAAQGLKAWPVCSRAAARAAAAAHA